MITCREYFIHPSALVFPSHQPLSCCLHAYIRACVCCGEGGCCIRQVPSTALPQVHVFYLQNGFWSRNHCVFKDEERGTWRDQSTRNYRNWCLKLWTYIWVLENVKMQILSKSRRGLRVSLHPVPGTADAAGPWITLWVVRTKITSSGKWLISRSLDHVPFHSTNQAPPSCWWHVSLSFQQGSGLEQSQVSQALPLFTKTSIVTVTLKI